MRGHLFVPWIEVSLVAAGQGLIVRARGICPAGSVSPKHVSAGPGHVSVFSHCLFRRAEQKVRHRPAANLLLWVSGACVHAQDYKLLAGERERGKLNECSSHMVGNYHAYMHAGTDPVLAVRASKCSYELRGAVLLLCRCSHLCRACTQIICI